MWGAQARRWEKMRCFLNAYERILEAIEATPKPFIYRINWAGRLESVTVR